jgi:hypothetical protein
LVTAGRRGRTLMPIDVSSAVAQLVRLGFDHDNAERQVRE